MAINRKIWKLDEQDKQRIKQLKEQGVENKQIAQRIGIHYKTVAKILREYGNS